jgi:hypothetical protein
MTFNIDGKITTCEDGDTYHVEIGRYRGAYKPRYTLDTPQQAVFYYSAINIGLGYKKRLVVRRADGKRIIVIRYAS